MAFSSSRNYLAGSGLRISLLRTAQLERTHSQTQTQSVRCFSDSNKYKQLKKDENLRVIMNIPKLMKRGIKVEVWEDDKIKQGERGIKIHPHTYEVMKHGAKDTWSAVAGRLKKVDATCEELKKVETWLDNVELLAKDIYKVLVVHQKQMKCEEKNPLDVFPDDLGSILIRLSKLRLKWRAIA